MNKIYRISILLIILAFSFGCDKKTDISSEKATNLTCPENYIIDNNECVHIDVDNENLVLKCEDGYILDKNLCVKILTVSPVKNYYCSEGEDLNNGYCYKTLSEAVTRTRSCQSGYNLIDEICSKETLTNALFTEFCPGGYSLVDNICTRKVETRATFNGSYYQCPSDYTFVPGNLCVKYITTPKTKNYYCLSGELYQEKCKVVDLRSPTIKDVCPKGFTNLGNKCSKVDSYKAKYKLSCTSNYKLQDDKCVLKLTLTPTIDKN